MCEARSLVLYMRKLRRHLTARGDAFLLPDRAVGDVATVVSRGVVHSHSPSF